MSRYATSFVLGYHGCDADVARRVVCREDQLHSYDNHYDWLGPGRYFWEADPNRALEFAHEQKARGKLDKPDVIGAVIDLRNCLDLLNRENLTLLADAYESYATMQVSAGLEIAQNKNVPSDPHEDRLKRFLDCAVIKHFHEIVESKKLPSIEPYDTVRGMFVEGGEVYPGSGIFDRGHIQIAVRSAACIKGYFYPLEDDAA